MTSLRKGTAGLATVALVALAVVGAAGAVADDQGADQLRGKGKPVIFTLFGEKMVEPKTIFLTANSGPYLDDLVWTRWGKDGADGEGTYVSECASCGPPQRLDVTVQARRGDRCKRTGGRAFRKVRYTVTREDGSEANRSYPAAFSLYCKRKG